MELGVEGDMKSNYKNFAQSFHKSFPLSLSFSLTNIHHVNRRANGWKLITFSYQRKCTVILYKYQVTVTALWKSIYWRSEKLSCEFDSPSYLKSPLISPKFFRGKNILFPPSHFLILHLSRLVN